MASIDSLSIQITASTGSAVTKIKALTKELVKLGIAIDALDVSKFETLSNATNSLSQGLAGLKGASVKSIEKAGKALANLNDVSKNDATKSVKKGLDDVSQEAQKVAENTEEVNESMKNMDPSGAEAVSSAMERVSSVVKKTSSEMSSFKKDLLRFKILIPTEGLEKVDKKISRLSEKIEELKDKINFKSQHSDYVDDAEVEKDQAKLQGLINELERLKLKKQELESHGGFKLNLGKGFSEVAKTIHSANSKLNGFISNIRKVNSHTKDTTKSTKEFSLASVKLAKELTRVTKMLKLMITRMMLRKVIQGVIDGFKNLVQYSSEVNSSVSMMWNSFRQLGNSIAAAVGPLLTALAPALNYIIQLCIKVVNAINQVISALLGRGTWTRAKTLTDDYGASLDKANKSAKDLKRTILGFDEINQLQDSSDSGGGAGGTSPQDMFEEAAIESKWKSLADKLKKILNQILAPIKKAWENVGDEVVAAWKGAFESIKKLLGDIGRDFLKVWNQPETIKMLENILRIFRDIGLVVKNLADGLDKAWNKNQTGLHILEAIRDIFAIVIQHVQNMTAATAEWAEKLDFSPILEAFKNWLESLEPVIDAISGAFEDFYVDVLLPLGKWSIEKGLPELIQVFTDFNDKVQWDVIRERLDRVWKALEPFAETVGEGLIKFIGDISDELADFLNSDGWNGFIDSLIEFQKKVDADDIAASLHVILDAFLAFKALSFLTTTISVITKFVESVGSLASTLGVFSAVLAGIVAFFTGADIGKLIGMKVFPDDKEIYRRYMGIIGTLRLLRDNVIAEKDAIVMAWDAFWTHVISQAKKNFATIGIDLDALKNKFTEFKNHLVSKFEELKNSVTAIIHDIKIGFLEVIKEIALMFSADNWTFDGVAEGLRRTFQAAKNAIKDIWNDIADTLNGEHQIGLGKFTIRLPHFYASGGFPDPEDGWFRASHGEMLGQFDNGQSVVANNEQIVDGIRQGVYEAVSMAMSTGQGGASYINNTIQVDGETIARAVTKGQRSIDRRYSPTMA